jgi:predicted Fe-Mo cluster-binding NifX family protein
MKIAVSASEPDLNGSVDPRFGRSPYFLLIETDTMEFEAIQNPNLASPSGAGIQSAQLLANKGVKALLTGSCGPNAFKTLEAAGVEVFIGVSGAIKQAVQNFNLGQLHPAPGPNVSAHSGMGVESVPPPGSEFESGFESGRGSGFGLGMGYGQGRGMGPGKGLGFTRPGGQWDFSSPEQELKSLKQRAENLQKQLESISRRIEELEKKKV